MRPMLLLAAVTLILGTAGCGGGTSSSGSTQVGVFVTDSFRDDYSHVWANIFKIEVVSATGAASAIFDDAAGTLIDLRSLHDATGPRFSFLSKMTIPPGNWVTVRVTVAPTMTLFPIGSTTGTVFPISDTVPRDLSGNPQITFNLPAPRSFAPSDDLVVDFDLANFTVAGGKVVPSLKEGGKGTLHDHSRHEHEDYGGTVSSLTGVSPNFTFTLIRGNIAFTVLTSSATAIFNSNALPNPTLTNGKHVEVRGIFDTTTRQLLATAIKIEDGSGSKSPEVKGSPSSINAAAGTFVLTTHEVHGFVPTTTTVNIVTDGSTVFRADSGITLAAADFFARLSTSTFVEVEGSYDIGTNTVFAKRAKLDDSGDGSGGGGSHDPEAEAKGTTVSINAAAGSFSLNPVTEYEGFVLTGTTLNVTTTGTTTYKAAGGGSLTAAAFFAALTVTSNVKVEGTYSAGIITATKIQIR